MTDVHPPYLCTRNNPHGVVGLQKWIISLEPEEIRIEKEGKR
ncbi:hypothetical protein HMPREF0673_03043 [Leyella stercorea DSM 18206]|uniref:Uncharacterized protein n=1 Tax=Leyella stercorea DSM 18206 TaxID=1002367 RepID=G6B2A9_9BACT|nr:hypothetical protein HMPREF0673_03043 [Leyella stercorea DSM 18206]